MRASRWVVGMALSGCAAVPSCGRDEAEPFSDDVGASATAGISAATGPRGGSAGKGAGGSGERGGTANAGRAQGGSASGDGGSAGTDGGSAGSNRGGGAGANGGEGGHANEGGHGDEGGAGDGAGGASTGGMSGAGFAGALPAGAGGATAGSGGQAIAGADTSGGAGMSGFAGQSGSGSQCSEACTGSIGDRCDSNCDCCCRLDDMSSWPTCSFSRPAFATCKSDGICHRERCGSGAGLNQSPPDPCADDTDCCSPFRCDATFLGRKVCCVGAGASCAISNCCDGLTCAVRGVGRTCGSCLEFGAWCDGDYQCCSGACCGSTGTCSIAPGQSGCSHAVDCGGATCRNGTCCLETGDWRSCTNGAECCSGRCTEGRCAP
jgi:hypothetical protein